MEKSTAENRRVMDGFEHSRLWDTLFPLTPSLAHPMGEGSRRAGEGFSLSREQTSLRRMDRRASMHEIIEVVEKIKGRTWKEFRDAYGDWGRDLALYLGRRKGGLKLKELAEAVGGIDSVGVGMAIKRFGERLRKDRRLAQFVKAAEVEL